MSDIRVEIQLADGSFTSGLLRARQSLSQFKDELARVDPNFRKLQGTAEGSIVSFRRLDQSSRSILQRLRDIAIVAGGATMAFRALTGASNSTLGTIVKVNAEMERLRFQLAGLSRAGDAVSAMKDAENQVREIQELAKTTPFAMNELTNSFVKMRVTGIDETTRSLKVLTDGVAAFGGNEESLHRITLGLTQMAGKGVIQMEELRQQLGESMPSAMKLMARSMGISVGELTKIIATGRLEAQSALRKWLDEVELTYGGRGAEMMKTFSGQLSLIRTSFVQLVTDKDSEVHKAFERLKTIMERVGRALQGPGARQFFDTVGIGMQSALGFAERLVEKLAEVVARIREMSDQLVLAGKIFAVGFVMNRVIAGMNLLRASAIGLVADVRSVTSAVRLMKVGMVTAATESQIAFAKLAVAMRGVQMSAVGPTSRVPIGIGGVLANARGFYGIMGSVAAVGARALSTFVPMGILFATLAPLAWDVSKAIWSWWQGADKANEEIKSTAQTTLEKLRSDLARARDAEEKSWNERIAAAEEQVEQEERNAVIVARAQMQREKVILESMRRRHAAEVSAAEQHATRLRAIADGRASRHGGVYDPRQERDAIAAEQRLADIRVDGERRLAEQVRKVETFGFRQGEESLSATEKARKDRESLILESMRDRHAKEVEEAEQHAVKLREVADAHAQKRGGFYDPRQERAAIEAEQRLADIRAAGAKRIADQAARVDVIGSRPSGALAAAQRAVDELVAGRTEALKTLDAESAKVVERHIAENAEASFREMEDRLRGQVIAAQTIYDKSADEAAQRRDQRVRQLRKEGKSTNVAELEYQQELREERSQLLDTEIKLWEAEQERVRSLEDAVHRAAELALIEERLQSLRERHSRVDTDQFMVDLLDQGDSPEKKQERLEKAFNSARDRVAELEAELRGASGAVAKLLVQIERGDFGMLDDGSEIAARMRQELVETTLAAETLKGVLDDVNSVTTDYDRIIDNQQQEMLEIEARLAGVDPADDARFMHWKLVNNKLPVNEDAVETVRRKVGELTNGLNIQQTTIVSLGESMIKTFGSDLQTEIGKVATAINGVDGAVAGLVTSLAGVGQGMAGLDMLGGLGTGIRAATGSISPTGVARQIWDFFSGKGLPDHVVSAIVGHAKAESGFDPTIVGDNGNAIGLFQHNGPRKRALLSSIAGPQDIMGQLQFTWSELLGSENATLKRLMASRNVEEATWAWQGFERPLGYDASRPGSGMHFDQRLAYAKEAQHVYAGTPPAPTNLSPYIMVDPSMVRTVQPALDGVYARDNQSMQQAADLDQMRILNAIHLQQNELRDKIAAAELEGRMPETVGQAQRNLEQDISAGKFGADARNNPAVQQMIRDAERLDAITRQTAETRKTDNELQTKSEDLARTRAELVQKEAEARERFKDPNYRGQSEDLRRLNEEGQKYLDQLGRRHGFESEIYKSEAARFSDMRSIQMRTEGYDAMGQLRQAAMDATRDTMPAREQARLDYEDRIAKLTSLRDYAIQMGSDAAAAEKLHAAAVHAERMKYLQEYGAGLTQKLTGMVDVEGQINQKVGGWVDGLSDALYDWASGEGGGFAKVVNKVREDLARSLTNVAAAAITAPFQDFLEGPNGIGALMQKGVNSILGNIGSSLGGAGGAGGVGGDLLTNALRAAGAYGNGGFLGWLQGLFSMMFGAKHTGGIVGHGTGMQRELPVSAFDGAPRFHTGGVVKSNRVVNGLGPGEVPIVAKHKEGVFTPEQMRHLGGTVNNHAISITGGPITVNGNGGSSEANADLARQIGQEQENAMRRLVQDQILREMRPGGMMGAL